MKTSKWDTCAGEAIVKGMGGHVMKPNLSDIDYNP
jgi:3'-phosphoadenosine 5'-phosphosulfate (PAPS) 3'-phosphatase